MEVLDQIQTELQYAEDAKNVAEIALSDGSESEITVDAALKENLKTQRLCNTYLMESDDNKPSILTEPHSVPDAQTPIVASLSTPTNMSQESSSCPPPPSPADMEKELSPSPSPVVDEEKESKEVEELLKENKTRPTHNDIVQYLTNKETQKENDAEIAAPPSILKDAEKFPWPGKTSIFGDLIKNMEDNKWKKHFKTRQQYFLPVESIVHEINTKYESLSLEILHFGAHQIPNVCIKCSHWENAASFHPPTSADSKTIKSWLRNVLGNTYVFGDLICAEEKPSTVCTAILMFRPENVLREDDIRQILSNKVNGVSTAEEDLETENLGSNATKFPWPWPKDTPIFEIINEDLQLYPWKKHFKETVQFTMDLRKLVTSLKVNYMGRLKIRIEFKTSFRNENTLIPNLYIKTNTWEKAHVLHAPTHSTQQEGEHWLRNVLGNIYLFGHALFVPKPTVDHTAMLLYMLNHRKESLNKTNPKQQQSHSPDSTQDPKLNFERSRLYKHLTFHKESRKGLPAPIPLPLPKKSSSRTFTRQSAANVREFKPRQKPASPRPSFDNYDDIYAKYRSNDTQSHGRRYGARHETSHYDREPPASHYDHEPSQYDRHVPIARPPMSSSAAHGTPAVMPSSPASARSFEEYAQVRQRYEEHLNYARMYREMYSKGNKPNSQEIYPGSKPHQQETYPAERKYW